MLLNEFTKIIRSRNIFGPSPHRRVYQNFDKNESRTLKMARIWYLITNSILKKIYKNERTDLDQVPIEISKLFLKYYSITR